MDDGTSARLSEIHTMTTITAAAGCYETFRFCYQAYRPDLDVDLYQ